jgi:hypothetical protein
MWPRHMLPCRCSWFALLVLLQVLAGPHHQLLRDLRRNAEQTTYHHRCDLRKTKYSQDIFELFAILKKVKKEYYLRTTRQQHCGHYH